MSDAITYTFFSLAKYCLDYRSNITLLFHSYLAFKSDYYTHIKDIPPQYGPGYDGGFGG